MTNEMVIVDGWLDGVKQVVSPNCNLRPEQSDIDLIVIHSISLPPGIYGNAFIEQFFQNKLDPNLDPYFEEIAGLEVSAHVLIDRQGALTQFVSLLERAWHAGLSEYQGRENCNDFSIGIELEGLEGEEFTHEQYRKLADLVTSLISQYPKITADRIAAHSDISPGRKQDPGEGFDWPRFNQLVDGNNN